MGDMVTPKVNGSNMGKNVHKKKIRNTHITKQTLHWLHDLTKFDFATMIYVYRIANFTVKFKHIFKRG